MATTDQEPARQAALDLLTDSAAGNIPGVDHVSITVRDGQGPLRTLAATDDLAERCDHLQYELEEGPCYAAVTEERFVLVNDLSVSEAFPQYGPRAADLGMGSQAAMQLVHDTRTAGLNLYAHMTGAFDEGTVQLAELFASHAAALLGFATQVDQLTQALRTRTDIAAAVGIVMERYGIDRDRAFSFLARCSQGRNVKIRVLAQQIIDGSFPGTMGKDVLQEWSQLP
ncbi:GAF and ANTAR domain-containing protein [Nocardioides zeicaulis]|uniref:GAF and ANTAR domain-containing protein n=1 Tax=Nocardioides zeicaulis TaxID=1776857 RepID=A0ABV6E384_9ACTN